jgi:hypothetical protein
VGAIGCRSRLGQQAVKVLGGEILKSNRLGRSIIAEPAQFRAEQLKRSVVKTDRKLLKQPRPNTPGRPFAYGGFSMGSRRRAVASWMTDYFGYDPLVLARMVERDLRLKNSAMPEGARRQPTGPIFSFTDCGRTCMPTTESPKEEPYSRQFGNL